MIDDRRNTPTLDQLVLGWIKLLPAGNPRVRAAFATFVRSSPVHLKVFLKHNLLNTELKGLDPERRIDVAPLIARARSRGNVIPWCGPHPECAPAGQLSTRNRSRRMPTIWGTAMLFAASALMIAPIVVQWHSTNRSIYETGVGERRQIRLPDGSTMQLNTQSRVQLDFTPARRDVRLTEGEVLFTIKHNRSRPFRIRIGETLIQDLGTQFNVRVRSDGVTVSVTDGQVRVMRVVDVLQKVDTPRGARFSSGSVEVKTYATIELAKYEEAMIPAGDQALRPRTSILTPQQIAARISWTRGVVTFTGQTLVEVLAEMSRYTRVRIEIDDPKLRELRLGGTFDPTDPLAFVATLEHIGVRSDVTSVLRTHSGTIHLAGSESGSRAKPRLP